MEVKIFNSFRGDDQFIINWSDCPDYFIKWLVKHFTNEKLDFKKHDLDVTSPAFMKFINFLLSDISDFSTMQFFEISRENVSGIEPAEFFKGYVMHDAIKLCKRKVRNAKIQICADIDDMPAPVRLKGNLPGQIMHVEKDSVDYGYGKPDRFSHHAEYFLYLSIRIYGVPFRKENISLEFRNKFLEKYNCQRVTEAKLKNFFEKNKGRKISIPLKYIQSADGWKYDFHITDTDKIIDQLEF